MKLCNILKFCLFSCLLQPMRALIQRVSRASVEIGQIEKSRIGQGLLVFLGIEEADTESDVEWLTRKIIHLRIFNDENGLQNLSIQDIRGEFLIISQFTLHAAIKKGNRPSFIKAAKPEIAEPLYQKFIEHISAQAQLKTESGIFGADMKVALVNDGPVTIWMDSKNPE